MNAIVEVATAETVAKTGGTTVIGKIALVFAIAKVAITKVATSPLRVLSIAGTSISAVSPDYNLFGGTALGAA